MHFGDFYILYRQVKPVNDNPVVTIVMTLLILSPMLYFIGKYYWDTRNNEAWEQGIFPDNLKFTRDNLMEAYICLAAKLVQAHTEDAGEKLLYMNQYFRRYFADSYYNFSESLSYSYAHPIQPRTVTRWINRHLNKKELKIQMVYFLAGLAMVDGQFHPKEHRLLNSIASDLGITDKEFASIIGMYSYKHERSTSTPTSDKTLRKLCCKVLGVPETANMQQIKKAYRKLVKLHHPDKFANESREQQEIAEERFREVQKAYEAMEKLLR